MLTRCVASGIRINPVRDRYQRRRTIVSPIRRTGGKDYIMGTSDMTNFGLFHLTFGLNMETIRLLGTWRIGMFCGCTVCG
jgi:hypothetical protein